ncbi:pyridoxal-phosphate dependent enzyme [Alsobacter sp. R-9]
MRNSLIRDAATGLDRLALARLPTPVDDAPRLAAVLGLASLRVKREDQSGYALGGNKLRQLDFLMAEAEAAGADILVSTAGSQSNFCRSLAGAAAKRGLDCHLHLRAATGTAFVGNLLLDTILGATVTFTRVTDPWDPVVAQELDAIAETYRAAGRKPRVIQLTGPAAATAVAGWVAGAAELVSDFEAGSGTPDAVVCVCGSGLTLAGLALGFKERGCPARVIGISAQQPASRLKPWIVASANQAAAQLEFGTRLGESDFDIIDTVIGPGYGQPSAESLEAVRLAGRTEGLLFDPVYTGKGIVGIGAALRDGVLRSSDHVVFIHSGGTPGLFAHGDAFAPGGAR